VNVRGQLAFAVVALFLVTAAASTAADGPSLSVDDAMITEADSGTKSATFTVSLSAPASEPVTVDYATEDGSATAPDDYEGANGTLTFAPGETSLQLVVHVAGDTLDEPHETYSLNLSNPAGATLADARGIGTILDNDPPVSVSVDDVSAAEPSGTLSFDVALSAESGKVITIAYATADGSATAPSDYGAGSGTLVFMPGQKAKAVSLALVDDDLVEGDETLTLTLSNAVGALLGDGRGTGTILDDDTDAPPPPPSDDPPPGDDPPPSDDPPPGDDQGGSLPPEPPAQEGPPAEPPNAAPDCSPVAPSKDRLWAPNHKFGLVTLAGAIDPDGDPVSFAITGVTQDERGKRGGDAQRAPSPDQLWLRAERNGRGDGRVYRIAYAASDDHGNSCAGIVLVTVPHDRAHAAVDSGGWYDSFAS
jgi:hypothetical protein